MLASCGVSDQLMVKFTKVQGSFSCYSVPTLIMGFDILQAFDRDRRISVEDSKIGGDLNHSRSNIVDSELVPDKIPVPSVQPFFLLRHQEQNEIRVVRRKPRKDRSLVY